MTNKLFAVYVNEARRLLGGTSRSKIYEDAGRAEGDPLKLDLVKDGGRTKVTIKSINRRNRGMPPAKVKARIDRHPRTGGAQPKHDIS